MNYGTKSIKVYYQIRYFAGNFFKIKDEWKKSEGMVFLPREQVMQLFKYFEKNKPQRNKRDSITRKKIKPLHILSIIAKKCPKENTINIK